MKFCIQIFNLKLPEIQPNQFLQWIITYDDDYAGEYIDGDKLVLLVVDLDSEKEEKYRKLCNNSPNVRFENAKYSLNELNEYENVIHNLVQEYQILRYGIDVKNNKFLIGVSFNDYGEVSRLHKNKFGI